MHPSAKLNKTSDIIDVHTNTHTVDIVVDLSSVVQQSEFLSAHYLPGLSISQLMTARRHAHTHTHTHTRTHTYTECGFIGQSNRHRLCESNSKYKQRALV